MTKFYALFDKNKIVIPHDTKVIPKEQFSYLLEGEELLQKIQEDNEIRLQEIETLKAQLHEIGQQKGFEEGLQKWAAQLTLLEKEMIANREHIAKTISSLAMTAVKKIIGKELDERPELVIDIIKTALRPVTQHRKIKIYVNKADLDLVESKRSLVKEVFENVETLAILPRDDIGQGGCIIETEAGIINAQLDRLLDALENAFKEFFKTWSVSEETT
ncbi:MAG: HrpE/YscL family type III secretion apparatus protein [Verrucomicrobia bacterium]|nr:HrpE/YscL family type III secretion apparatus protein [Verrucomicrobiota bacterium]MBS0646291.1 HrpE/YscL family type III secretion apparatus protein [Verrucomicrobiota bacterium]